jgi:hypothetical protein
MCSFTAETATRIWYRQHHQSHEGGPLSYTEGRLETVAAVSSISGAGEPYLGPSAVTDRRLHGFRAAPSSVECF